jgi:hypothetical protein
MEAMSLLASTARGSSGCRRAKVGQRRRALRRAHGGIGEALHGVDPPLAHPALDELERPDDAGEQVVEVVRDPAGELPDRLHLVRLT